MNMSIVCYLHPLSLILPNAPSLSLRRYLKHKAKECFCVCLSPPGSISDIER